MLFATTASFAQAVISGKVKDEKGRPVKGASVSLDNTIDGGTTDSAGVFKFTTDEKGSQTLVATETSHANAGMALVINGNISDIVLTMKTVNHNLEEVVISAGSFEASNDKNKAALTTMDIVTTAGAQADVVRAIQTLPGTQQQGTENGLFVRGGDASEAAIVVDGLVAQNAFFSSAPGVAARSRFSPWQFKGVSFSSGGYSARYGEAMSSVLELNTLDMPDKSTINAGINMAGVYASGSKLWKNSGGDISASYNNLSPFYNLAKTNVEYYNVPQGGNVGLRYAWKPNKNGTLKVMATGSRFQSGVRVPDPGEGGKTIDFGLVNTNFYTNVSYKQFSKNNKWTTFAAASYSYNKDDISFGSFSTPANDNRLQLRVEEKRKFDGHFNLLLGVEMQHFNFNRSVDTPGWHLDYGFGETQLAAYLEAEWGPFYWLAIRPGVRYERSQLLGKSNIAPRISMAVRAGSYGQVAVAGGMFYQSPDNQYLLYGYRPGYQHSIHYIANFQYIRNGRTFRVEGYYKDYNQLVREKQNTYDPNQYNRYLAPVDNSGYGYAKGAELFWRDKKTVKYFDYWVSYSYIDTRRLYKNYLAEVTPTFISNHNLSIVTKYWIEKWKLSVNGTYSYASGRPYYDPANPQFLGDRTPEYHNLAFTLNYLTHVKKWFTVIYSGVDNVTNHENIFGYRYDSKGVPHPIKPALYRSFFVGVNFSLSEFNKDEL